MLNKSTGTIRNVRVQPQEIDEIEETILDFSDSYHQAIPVIETAAGVAWSYGMWQFAAGYELTNWFNLAEIDRASYDLLLDGFFVRLGVAY